MFEEEKEFPGKEAGEDEQPVANIGETDESGKDSPTVSNDDITQPPPSGGAPE